MATSRGKQIAKNTILLYVRMFLVMGISLYTSRVILQVLGFEDFGIYNVVGTIVVLFSFFSNSLVAAIQRYLSFSLGQDDFQRFDVGASVGLDVRVGSFRLAMSYSRGFLDRFSSGSIYTGRNNVFELGAVVTLGE